MSDLFFSSSDDSLEPITAGLAGRLWGWWKNYTSAERRANAALQLRDRFGRFAEMGRDHKFKFKNKSGVNENATGVYIGPASREGYGRFYVKDHPTLGTGVVEVSNKNFREVLTSLSEDYLRSRGIKLGQDATGNIVGARKESDIPSMDDLNFQPATDEDLEAATSKVEEMPDLEEVIKDADSGAIRYGDIKPGVIVRDEAGNRLGIVTQVDIVDGKVVPVIRWQDGERTTGVGSDPEDLVNVWIPSEDADTPEGNKEKEEVKARLQLMAFKDGDNKTTAADLAKGDTVIVEGQPLKVKSKKEVEAGTFKIAFADENGDTVLSELYDAKDKFDLPKKEKPKAAKPDRSKRDNVPVYAPELKRGDVLLVGQPPREVYAVSVKENKDPRDPGKTTYDVTVELADTGEVVTIKGVRKGQEILQRAEANEKGTLRKVNRKSQMKSAAPAAEPVKPTAELPEGETEEPSAITDKQRDSINRRLNEGRYPGIVSEARAQQINDALPTLDKGSVGRIIKELDEAELKWRMNNGWPVDELVAKRYTNKDGTVAFPNKQLAEKYKAYVPTKDENGEPLPGVEQPEEVQPAAVESDFALPESGEVGATGNLTNRLKYEIRPDGSILFFDDKSAKYDKNDGTYAYKDLINSALYSKDARGNAKRTQEKDENGKFAGWSVQLDISRNNKDFLSPEEFRKEILQRIFNRINNIEDPNDTSSTNVTVPDEPVSEVASTDVTGAPGESGSLGNGVGYSIDNRNNVVIHGDIDQGTANGDLIDQVIFGNHDGYDLVSQVDDATGALVISVNSTDAKTPTSTHIANFLKSIKEALDIAPAEEPAPEPEVEQPAAEAELETDPWDSLPPRDERTLEDIVDALFRTPKSISADKVKRFGPPTDKMAAAIKAIKSEPGVVSQEISDNIDQILPNLDESSAGVLVAYLKNAQNIKRMANGQRPNRLDDFSIFGIPKSVTDKFVDEIKLINFYLLSDAVDDSRKNEIEQILKDGSSRENVTALVKELQEAFNKKEAESKGEPTPEQQQPVEEPTPESEPTPEPEVTTEEPAPEIEPEPEQPSEEPAAEPEPEVPAEESTPEPTPEPGAEPTPEPEAEQPAEEAPAAEPEVPAVAPTPTPEPEEDEEQETKLTPDRELETVQAADVVEGDLVWDDLRGFARVSGKPTQDEKDPNVVVIPVVRPGDDTPRRLRARKGAKLNIAKREVSPAQPTPTPEPTPTPSPQPTPSPAPEGAKPRPKKPAKKKSEVKLANVYYMDPNGRGKPKLFTLNAWRTIEEKERILGELRKLEDRRRAQYDESIEGMEGTPDPYRPMFVFEDGFEFSSEAATKKQLQSVARRLSIPGLLSSDELKKIASDLPNMNKSQIFDLIDRLDGLELDWRISNGYPVTGLRVPKSYDMDKLKGYTPTKKLSDIPPASVPDIDPKPAAMSFVSGKTIGTDLGMILNPTTMDVGRDRQPTPGAFTGSLLEAVQGKNWSEVLDYIKNLETPIYYFDTETTGISDYDGDNQPNNAVQVGIVKVVKGEVIDRFNIYLNPEAPLGEWSAANLKRDVLSPTGEVIGDELVTDQWLSEQMSTEEAVRQMIDFMGDNPIIGGQNVPFDLEVLQRMLDKAGVTDFTVAATVDSKDLIDAIIPKYDAEKGIDGPKKETEKGSGVYVSTTSLGYVAKFLGFDTTKWHSADADAEDAFRLVMRSLEMASAKPNENLWALDKDKLAERYNERMTKFLAGIDPNGPASDKQNGNDKYGFRKYLVSAGFTPEEQERILDPINTMTRGQAAQYISAFIKQNDSKKGPTPETRLNLQRFIDSAESGLANSIAAGRTDVKIKEVVGSKKRSLLRPLTTNFMLKPDRKYAKASFMESALGGADEVQRIYSTLATDPDSQEKLAQAEALFEAKMSDRASLENNVVLEIDDLNYISYNTSDGVEITPEHLQKLSRLMSKTRELAPLGNKKVRVQLVTNEEMGLLKREDPNNLKTSAFFTFLGGYLHIVMRKESFYETRFDPRITTDSSGKYDLHNTGSIPGFVKSFLHEYGHAYHRAVLGSTMLKGENSPELTALAKEYKEKFKDTYISEYGETNHLEKFADLFFDYSYSKLANRAPANPEFTKFMDGVVGTKPAGIIESVKKVLLSRFNTKGTYSDEMPSSSIQGVKIDGISEVTGQNLTELERSMEGYSRGNWLAGTDAGSGLIPSEADSMDYFVNKYLRNLPSLPSREEVDALYRAFKEARAKALADSSSYRVFRVDATNQFIRVKDAVATPEIISDVVSNVRTMAALNNLGNIPTYYTIFEDGWFGYDVYMKGASDFAGIADSSKEHGVFLAINAGTYGNRNVSLSGINYSAGGPDARDRFTRTLIHEYGHAIAKIFLGDNASSPLYQEFQQKFGDKPQTTYGATSPEENFAEYFYALYMWVTEKGAIPSHLQEFAEFFNSRIAGKNPLNQPPRSLITAMNFADSYQGKGDADSVNFPEPKADADPMAEFYARRPFYENTLTPKGTKLDGKDAELIRDIYRRTLNAESAYLAVKNNPGSTNNDKKFAQVKFEAHVGALKTAYDSIVLGSSDKYDMSKEYPGEKFSFMQFSSEWRDDEQGYPVIWDSYEDMPVTYADPLEKDVFDAEERSALKNYGNSGWRWISSLLRGDTLSPTVSDMAESMLRGLGSAFNRPEAKLTRDMYLYHGSTGYPGDGQYKDLIDAKPGDEITLPSYTSTSMSPNVAYEDFGPGSASLLNPEEEGFFVIIRAPKGSNAIVMPQGLSYSDNEREVLLNSGAKLRVLEVSRSPRLDSEGYAIPGAYSTYIEADLLSTESLPDREFATPAGATRNADFEQSLDYLTSAFAQSFNPRLQTVTDPNGGLGSSNSVIGYVRSEALAGMPGNTDIDKKDVAKKAMSMAAGSIPTSPIVVSYDPETKQAYVLDGNHRVAAALESGMPMLPVVVVTNTDTYSPNAKTLDKGWAIPPFGIDETGTSEKWPDKIHPYFVFDNADMLTPAANDGKPLFMQFEPSIWSSKVSAEDKSVPRRFKPEAGPSEESSQYDFEQVPPGSYVVDKKTGRIGVVYGEHYNPGEQTSAGVIVKYLEGSEDSYPSGFFIDDEFDEKGVRRVESGLASSSGYSDIRYYTLKITNPADLENVTESFITPGTDGILVGDTMFGVIKGTDKRGRIVGFPAKGALTIAVDNQDGTFSFENIPLSEFLPIQSQRPSVIKGVAAFHSKDMMPTKDDLDEVLVKATNLYNWGYLPENVYKAVIESVRGRFLTKSGTRDLANYLTKFDSLRARKIDGKKAGKVAPARRRSDQPIQEVQQPQAPVAPQNVGNMTINEFLDYLKGSQNQPTLMQYENGEENTTPDIKSQVETNPPTAADLRTVQNILQEAGVVSDQRAKELWNMLPFIDADILNIVKKDLLTSLLNKRIANGEPVAGIEIPAGFDRSKLDGYVPKNNLDGSPVQVPTTKERPEAEQVSMDLSDEQKWLYNHLESTKTPVFITGKAGTGKSFLLKFFRDFSEKNVAVTAFTGTAAENVGGTTIHSLFGLKPGIVYGNTPASELITGSQKRKAKIRKTLEAIDTLIVDEVSMVSADLMDAMDRILRNVKGKPFVPFGGVQFVGFGDVFQLSPFVGKKDVQLKDYMEKNYRSLFFFDARAWVDQPLEVYELSQVFRQSDPEFKQVLNNIRIGEFSQEDLDFINEKGLRPVPGTVDDLIYAVSRNDIADKINQEEMDKLGNVESFTYTGEFDGAGKEAFDMLPAPDQLFLKVGAQVMFTRNDTPSSSKDQADEESGQGENTSRRWVNGTVGKVVALEEDHVKVRVGDKVYDVYPTMWDKVGYDASQQVDAISNQVTNKLSSFTEATYKQIPLIPAWAATIHKLQGKTISNLKLDLGEGGAFATGQLYTGLSRVKSLDGLYLERPIRSTDVKVDFNAKRFAAALDPVEDTTPNRPTMMQFGGEPFDPSDPNLDLDKALGYDFTVGPYGIPLTGYQKDWMDTYASDIAKAEEQFGSNSNRVKELKSLRRQHYASWMARPNSREDNVTESALQNLKINFDDAETSEVESTYVTESDTYITASYKDRYGREYEMEANVKLTENDYDPYALDTHIEVKVYDRSGDRTKAIGRMNTQFGGPMEGPLANELYIGYIETAEAYQRRHIASGMLAFARQLTDKKIRHSDKLTKMGHAFMESVELDDRLKTVRRPNLVDMGEEVGAPMVINISKLSESKSSSEITDILQRLNADGIEYRLEY